VRTSLSQGLAGGQTWNLGLNSADPGRIDSTVHATKGLLTFNGTLTGVQPGGGITQGVINGSSAYTLNTAVGSQLNWSQLVCTVGAVTVSSNFMNNYLYQFAPQSTLASKDLIGCQFETLIARNSTGTLAGGTGTSACIGLSVVSIMDNESVTYPIVTGLRIKAGANRAGGTATTARVYHAIGLNGGTNGTLTGFYMENPSGGVAMTTLYGMYLESLSAGSSNFAIFTNLGKVSFGDNVAINPIAGTVGLLIQQASTPTVDAVQVKNSAAANLFRVQKNGATSGLLDTMSYASTITLDVTKGNVHKTTTVNATGNATINASAGGVAGEWSSIDIVITNDATSGKVITFGTNFSSTGTLTGTTSKTAVVTFVSDGVTWYERARTTGLT
jgi:hypothetical protein